MSSCRIITSCATLHVHERVEHVVVVVQCQSELFQIVLALSSACCFARLLNAGKSSAIKMAMIAITTSNSMSVNPRLSRNLLKQIKTKEMISHKGNNADITGIVTSVRHYRNARFIFWENLLKF